MTVVWALGVAVALGFVFLYEGRDPMTAASRWHTNLDALRSISDPVERVSKILSAGAKQEEFKAIMIAIAGAEDPAYYVSPERLEEITHRALN